MAVLPLFRLVQIFVLLTLLFAILFVAPICTPLVPYEPCSNATDTPVIKPLNVFLRTENSSSQVPEVDSFVTEQRMCLSINHTDIFTMPTFGGENPKDTLSLFFLMLFISTVCVFIASVVMMQTEKSIDYQQDCGNRFISIVLSLMDFCMVFICSYMVYVWPDLWTSRYSSAPQIPVNIYVIHILVLINFVLGVVNSFFYTPRVEMVKLDNLSGGKKSYQLPRRYEALQD